MSVKEICEFPTFRRLTVFLRFCPNCLFLTNSWSEAAYRNLTQLPVSDFLPAWVSGHSAEGHQWRVKGESSLLLNLTASHAYSGLLAAGSEAGQAGRRAGRQAGVLADGLACGFLEACVGDDCLYIGFHLCVGPIFIFPRYPDAMVID